MPRPFCSIYIRAHLNSQILCIKKPVPQYLNQGCKHTFCHDPVLKALVVRKGQMDRLLAPCYKRDVLLEEGPQILCHLLIVFLSANTATFQFPGVVTILGGKSDILLVLYLSGSWSFKLAQSYLLRQEDSVGLLGQVLVHARLFLEVGTQLAVFFLYWAPFHPEFFGPLLFQPGSSLPQLIDENGLTSTTSSIPQLNFWEYLIPLVTCYAVHVFIVIMSMIFLESFSPVIFSSSSLRRLFLSVCYACTSLIVTTPSEDWNLGEKDNKEFILRKWRKVQQDYLSMEVIHLMANFLLMGWCYYHYPDKIQDQWHYYYAILTSPFWLIVLSLCKIGLFEGYHRYGNPWGWSLLEKLEVKPKIKTD